MIDAEQLIFTLLTRDKPTGVTVQANIDTDSIDTFPLVTYDYHGVGQQSNGDNLWSVVLSLNLFHNDPAAIFGIVSALNDAVHAWADQNTGQLPSVGHVQETTDLDIFAPVSDPTIESKIGLQYAGSWTLLLRNT